jgi:DNA invertase Pin-like site-specific DNA recombinase
MRDYTAMARAHADISRLASELAAADEARRVAVEQLTRAVREGLAAGLPVVELARLAGVSRPTIYAWINEATS